LPGFAAEYLFLPSPWNDPLATSWAAPNYQLPALIDQQVSQELAAAATPSQVKLCPYDAKEPAIRFRLIEAQFAAALSQSQKL
jgi:hypothetical protein